jgi:hypothetical protein
MNPNKALWEKAISPERRNPCVKAEQLFADKLITKHYRS